MDDRALPPLHGLWWAPLAFVGFALALLFVTPLVVEHRVAKIRNARTNVTVNARATLNDLEAAVASQLLVRSHEIEPTDTAAVATRAHLDHDVRDLAAYIPQTTPAAVAQFGDLAALVREWMRESANPAASPGGVRARDIVATAEQLDASLGTLADAQGARIQQLEHYDIVAAVILAPVALLSILFVLWAGGRVQSFARAAASERAEVIRAADARAALLRGVTHDLKNPLGAAAGYAQLLEEGVVGPIAEPQRQMVERIHRLIDLSVETVTDLLELARADSGGLHLEYEETDLARLATEVVEDHRALARERRLEVALTTSPAPLVTDPLRVRQILSNLLSNAIKYTPPGESIGVTIVREPSATRGARGARAGVEVRDTGPGIPRELESRVFEEFFRVRQAASPTRGNGLGLAISRRLARLLGGDVVYRRAEPHGSVFTLWLESANRAPPKTPPARPAAPVRPATE